MQELENAPHGRMAISLNKQVREAQYADESDEKGAIESQNHPVEEGGGGGL